MIELSLKMEQIHKQSTRPQVAQYHLDGYIIVKTTMRRRISLVLGLLLVCFMAYSQNGLSNSYPQKDFSKWTKSELILNNGIVQRTIKLPSDTGSFLTTSYGPVIGKFHYFSPQNIDFQFEIDGRIYSGKTNWNLVQIRTITDDLQGNGAAVILQSTDKKIELTVNFLMYPGLPVVRKYLAVKNISKEEISLESVDVEKLNFANYYPSTYSWIYGDYGRRRSIGPYEGNMQDALLIIHDSDKEAGIIVGNEASGVLKRTSVFWNAQDLCTGLTHKDARFPFRKWIKTGESFETPKVFTMVYNNQKDPNTVLNSVLPDFIRKHMGIRLSELKQKPTFVYNTWNPFKKDINEKLIMELAKAAAAAGMKEFVIDDGWEDNLGDWGIDKRKFPNGLKPVFDYIKSLGMKPGLWISVGSASSESKVYHEHPEWFVKDKNDRFTNLHIAGAGDGINDAFRSACFSTGWKDYIKNILLKLTLDYGLEYMKLDFSVVTSAYVFDSEKSGCYASNHQGHKDHNESLYSNYEQMWNLFDELHAAKPNLFIDCTFEAMGGLQLIDYAMLKHAEGNWLSNFYAPDELGDLRIRNLAWWRSPAMSATALVIGNPKMEDKGWELHIKSLAGALPIMLGDPRKLSIQDLKKYRSYADWLQSMQSKYDIMSYRQDLAGFGEPMQGMWDGFQRINTEIQSGGIIGVFRHGSLEAERFVRIKHLNPQKTYSVKSCLSNRIIKKSTGENLSKMGFKVTIPDEYGGELFEVAEDPKIVQAKPLFFDFGTKSSMLAEGFMAVTPDLAWSPEVGFGWVGKPSLVAVEKADLVKVNVLQRPLKPGMPKTFDEFPVFLNALSEDHVSGNIKTNFRVAAPHGAYKVWILLGSPGGGGISRSNRYVVWDTRIACGKGEVSATFPGEHEARVLTMDVVSNGVLDFQISTRNRWIINGMAIVPTAQWDSVKGKHLARYEQDVYQLPKEQWAKWTKTEHEEKNPMPEFSNKEFDQGLVTYTRSYISNIWPNTAPLRAEIDAPLRAFATPGEYEPLNFAILPLRDIKNVRVKFSDLKSKEGHSINASSIDTRFVKYMWTRPNYNYLYTTYRAPDVLMPMTSSNLKKGENFRVWATVRVGEATPEGIYRGKAEIFSGEKKLQEVMVELSVLPIKLLKDQGITYGMYYNNPLISANSANDGFSREWFRGKAEKEIRDMIEHGMNSVERTLPGKKNESGDFEPDFDSFSLLIDVGKRIGFSDRPMPLQLLTPVNLYFEKYGIEKPGLHLKNVKMPPQGYFDDITRLIERIEVERKKRGWPEFLYYPLDEPEPINSPDVVPFVAKLMESIKKVPGVRTYMTGNPINVHGGPPWDPIYPFIDVWCNQPFKPDFETIKSKTGPRKDAEYWCYPNHVCGENDHTRNIGARMTYGFGFWRSGYRGLIPWIYQYNQGNPWNYLDGQFSDVFLRTADDGSPIPTVTWEVYREGIDDMRYITTLEYWIERAKAVGRKDLAKAGRDDLDSIWNSIKVYEKYKDDGQPEVFWHNDNKPPVTPVGGHLENGMWPPQVFDNMRWILASRILEIQKDLNKKR